MSSPSVELLRGVRWEHAEADAPAYLFTSLNDETPDGPVREEIRALVRRIPTHPFLS
jgi:hypothetical protein